MASSKIENGTNIHTNGTLFCAVFNRTDKKTNGDLNTYYYWLQTPQNGAISNKRNNKMNGNFDDLADALANPPSGYSAVSSGVAWENQKLLYYLNSYPLGDGSDSAIAVTKSEYLDAKNKGFDGIVVMIDWSAIFPTYASQTSNTGTWTKYDELITYARDLGLKVALRIWTCQTNQAVFGNNDFYAPSGCMTDEWGNPLRLQAFNHVSLAYTTGINMVYDYVGKVLSRYSTILGSQFSFFSVNTTKQQEAGYNYEGQQLADNTFVADLFPQNNDHSTHFLTYLRNTYLPANYTNVADLNTSWGTSYSSFSEAVTPKTGLPNATASQDQIIATYQSNQGRDFWKANEALLDSFIATCKASGVSNASQAKFALEYGDLLGVLGANRHSLNVEGMNSKCDLLKAKTGAITANDAFHNDIIRIFDGKKGTEYNYTDRNQYGFETAEQVENGFVELATNAIQSGVTLIVIMGGKSSDSVLHDAMMRAGERIRPILSNFTGSISNIGSFSFSLGEAIINIDQIRQRWHNAGGGKNNRIAITQSQDIPMSAGGGCNVNFSPSTLGGIVYSDYGYFCLHENSIKSSVYRNGSSALKNDYNINRFPLEGGTFSIDYIGNTAKTTYRVIGRNDGITWIKFTQTAPKSGTGSPNNHPVIADDVATGEDCTFWLPQTQDYIIEMDNTGTGAVGFRIQTTRHDAVNFFDYQRKLLAGKTHRFIVLKSRLDGRVNLWEKRLKINHNRNTESEGWVETVDNFYRIEGESEDRPV
jgi:hypothetical protein